MKAKLSPSFKRNMQAKIGAFTFEVGILNDKAHKEAKSAGPLGDQNQGTFAGGPIRKKSSATSPLSIGEIFIENQKRLNRNILSEPFNKKSSELRRFVDGFFKLVLKDSLSIKRVENLLQAVVRNPILRGDYGQNSAYTADNKGFDRLMIDTAQTFRQIKAKAKRARK